MKPHLRPTAKRLALLLLGAGLAGCSKPRVTYHAPTPPPAPRYAYALDYNRQLLYLGKHTALLKNYGPGRTEFDWMREVCEISVVRAQRARREVEFASDLGHDVDETLAARVEHLSWDPERRFLFGIAHLERDEDPQVKKPCFFVDLNKETMERYATWEELRSEHARAPSKNDLWSPERVFDDLRNFAEVLK